VWIFTLQQCIDLTIELAMEYGTALEISGLGIDRYWTLALVLTTSLEISGSAVQGSTINALAVDIGDGTGLFELTDCNLPEFNISAELDLPYSTYHQHNRLPTATAHLQVLLSGPGYNTIQYNTIPNPLISSAVPC